MWRNRKPNMRRTLLFIGFSAVMVKPRGRLSALAFSQLSPRRLAYHQVMSYNIQIMPQLEYDEDDAVSDAKRGRRAYQQMMSHSKQMMPQLEYDEDDAVSDAKRRQALAKALRSITCGGLLSLFGGSPCSAANLPTSTGADMSRTGTLEKLIPLVAMENALMSAKQTFLKASDDSAITADTIEAISKVLASSIPPEQTLFKRKFDEYSEPVSYKQKFMDQNAFLVYYTKGFDGPNRPPMESSADPIPLQSIQYGLRNDAWTNYDELLSELSFFSPSSSTIDDILKPLDNCIASFEAYFSAAPASDVADARRRLK